MDKKKMQFAFNKCYEIMYKCSVPRADFTELINGDDPLFYQKHAIEEDLAMRIIDNVIRDFKIKPKYLATCFKSSILLGCSPVFYKKDEKSNEENEVNKE